MPQGKYKHAYLMRSIDNNYENFAPGDKYVFLIDGTVDASGNVDVDLGTIIQDSAILAIIPLRKYTAANGVITVDADATYLSGMNTGDAVTCLVIADPNQELAFDDE